MRAADKVCLGELDNVGDGEYLGPMPDVISQPPMKVSGRVASLQEMSGHMPGDSFRTGRRRLSGSCSPANEVAPSQAGKQLLQGVPTHSSRAQV
jgi:hypothetical protein